jgi:N-acetylmuramoyl-L-alanine amidase
MLKKSFGGLLLFSICTVLTSFEIVRQYTGTSRVGAVKTIILDAGHGITPGGGKDGAPGRYSHEDEICLAIVKKLLVEMKKQMPDVKLVETRPTEYRVDLHERADIANNNKGDLFISIHCNSADPIYKREFSHNKTVTYYVYQGKGKKKKKIPKTKEVAVYVTRSYPNPAKGTETYIWGAHKNGSKEEAVAKSENASIYKEADYKQQYGEVDVNSQDFFILMKLKTQQYFKRSYTLASHVQDEFAEIGRIDRDVRQRSVGIWVLQATAMPSILVETGYISNPEEENYLNSEKGQNELSQSITRAVKRFKAEIETPKPANGNTQKKQKETLSQAIAALLRKEEHNTSPVPVS